MIPAVWPRRSLRPAALSSDWTTDHAAATASGGWPAAASRASSASRVYRLLFARR